MKKFSLSLVTVMVLSLCVAAQKAPKEGSYSGEIMDAACAKAGGHSGMMKQMNIKTAKECTEGCVKNGSKYVLYDKAHKKVYQLDDQTKPAQFAGDKVTVKGTLDASTDTIKVSDIEAAKGATKAKAGSPSGQ
ncbi:MAG TPA: DUF5818 domain-containing protein [Candidatus Angelobacter sp.]|nr:DUF5818 domain-containing protein [Candidatus Angelobacter sp.]